MKTALRSLLIDDEPAARLRLRRMLEKRSGVELIDEARDGVQAVEQIERLKPDLIFLDVQMPGLDGFGVLRALAPTVHLPLVIFVTGYDEYALKAFQAQALAYLLKPVEPDLLDAAIERASGIRSYRQGQEQHDGKVRQVIRAAPRGFDRIVGRKGSRLLLLDPADICFFWIDAGILRAQTVDENYWVSHTIGELEEALTGGHFFRAHRSALVNLKWIGEIRPDVRSSLQLVMKDRGQTPINVSERQGRVLRTLIQGL